ncbi:MAG TPA: DUF6329 domain-containing protein [Bacillota bacterium]|nr:DUF6329 domain-containing protein [Bacillota bacterium]
MKRIETARWKPTPNQPSKLEYDGQRTAQEVFEELSYRLENTGYLPEEYFLLDSEWLDGKEFPQNADIFCTTDYGASEGIYTDVYLRIYDEGNGTTKKFATGKTLGESESDLDRMNLIASAITKAFHSDGIHARFIRLGEAERSEGLIVHLNEEERLIVADSLIEMRTQLQDKTMAVENLLRRVAGSITEYINMVGDLPLRISDTDLAILAIQDGNMAAFLEAFPKAEDQGVVLIHAAGRPGRIGTQMTLEMLQKTQNSIPNDIYLDACKKAVNAGDSDRVVLMMRNAESSVKDLDMGLFGKIVRCSLEYHSENGHNRRMAHTLVQKCTPGQIQAADPALLLLAQRREDWQILFRLIEQGINANQYAAEFFDQLSRQGNAWMIYSCVDRGMKIDNNNFAAFHACIRPESIDVAKRLIELGTDFDGYLEWAEKYHSGEKDESLISILKEYWENDIKPKRELKLNEVFDPDSHHQTQSELNGDTEYVFKLQVYPSYLPEKRGRQFTLELPVSESELWITLSKHGINDFSQCDVASCECSIKRLSNTMNLEGNIHGLNRLAAQIKDMIGNQERVTKFLAVLEEARPSELSDAIDCMDELDRYELLPQNVKTPADQIKEMGITQELNM